MEAASIHVKDLNAWFGATQALHNISMEIPAKHLEMVWPPYSTMLAEAFDACLDPKTR